MKRLTDIRGLEVVNEDGERLGHVWEVRCDAHRIDPSECTIAGLFCGKRGMLERFGIEPRSLQRVDWSAVIRIEANRVVVRGVRSKAKA